MLKFRSLTNVRPTKDLGSQVICAPTPGQFKVTPEAAKAIGVSSEDYLQVVMDDSTGIAYAVKGEDGLGGKLAASNKAGAGMLTFSAANAWDEMKGDIAFNVHYNLDTENAVVNDGEEGDGKTYFPLTFAEKVEKQTRVRKDGKIVDADDEDEDEEIAEGEDTSFEEM